MVKIGRNKEWKECLVVLWCRFRGEGMRVKIEKVSIWVGGKR